MKARVSLSILLIVLAAGLCGRLVRQLTQQGGAQVEREEAQAERFLVGLGWSVGERVAITANFDYAARVFRRQSCQQVLLVSVIGAGGDAGGLFKRMAGVQWRFMHLGIAYDSPPSLRFMVDYGLALALGQRSPPSIVAVALAPIPAPEECEGPSPQDWRSFTEAAPSDVQASNAQAGKLQEGKLQEGLRTSAE